LALPGYELQLSRKGQDSKGEKKNGGTHWSRKCNASRLAERSRERLERTAQAVPILSSAAKFPGAFTVVRRRNVQRVRPGWEDGIPAPGWS
jgi:hypothetical protein